MEDEIICGKMDEGFLIKADRIFPNDNEGIFVELLQNARRAGAKAVRITIEEVTGRPEECRVTIHDDGCGIDQFQGLVTLGKTGWDASTKATEDPAGMGFYSLCLSGEVEVASGSGVVIITRDVFLGKEKARVQRAAEEVVAGTRLRFVRRSGKQTLTAALANVTEFFPVDVYLDGNVLPRHDFLEGAIHREVIDGVEVGFSTFFKHRGSGFQHDNWNFYGLTIHHQFPGISGIIKPKETSPLTLEARFNVLETGRITLKLPDRSSVVQDEFLKQFEQKALAAAYRCFQKEPCHALSFTNWREAAALGIVLPEAVCRLTTWSAASGDDGVDPPFGYDTTCTLSDLKRAMLVSDDLAFAHTLQGALHCDAAFDHDLYHEIPEYSGYSWYDAMPRLIDVEMAVDGVAWEDCPAFTSQNRPSEIQLSLHIRQLEKVDRVVCLPAYIHVDTDEPNEISFVAVKASPWDNDDLSGPFDLHGFLLWATFRASEDLESDSWATQYDYHEDRVQEELNDYFRGPRANLIVLLRKLSSDAHWLANRLGVTGITLQRADSNSRDWNIKLLDANGPID